MFIHSILPIIKPDRFSSRLIGLKHRIIRQLENISLVTLMTNKNSNADTESAVMHIAMLSRVIR
jgi:hypothetical protein